MRLTEIVVRPISLTGIGVRVSSHPSLGQPWLLALSQLGSLERSGPSYNLCSYTDGQQANRYQSQLVLTYSCREAALQRELQGR